MGKPDFFDDVFDLSKSLEGAKKAHGKKRKDAQPPATKDAHLGERIGSFVPKKGVAGSKPPVDRTIPPNKGPGSKTAKKSLFPMREYRATVWEGGIADTTLAGEVETGIAMPSMRNPVMERRVESEE